MLSSMTGFARVESIKSWGNVTWEIKSVNHRFLEAYFKLPENIKNIEPTIREILKNKISRGKVECILRLDLNKTAISSIKINKEHTAQVIYNLKKLKDDFLLQDSYVNLADILNFPGVITTEDYQSTEIYPEILESFDMVLNEFITVRQREGYNIQNILLQKLDDIVIELNKIIAQMPAIIQWQKDKILQRFSELDLEIDKTRLEQEIIWFTQKIDIEEELDRLTIHIAEIKNILNTNNLAGRKLDFMMQELNRESNTIASKSINSEITTSAIELKVLIEQMREQIQNIE